MKCLNEFNLFYCNKFQEKLSSINEHYQRNLAAQYKKAIQTISKYPLPIVSCYQIDRLEGFGKQLGPLFEAFMEDYRSYIQSSGFDFKSAASQINQNKPKKQAVMAENTSKKRLTNISPNSSTWNLLLSLHFLNVQNEKLTFLLDDVKTMSETICTQISYHSKVKIDKITTEDFEALKRIGLVNKWDELFIYCHKDLVAIAENEEKKSKIEVTKDELGDLKVNFLEKTENKANKQESSKPKSKSSQSSFCDQNIVSFFGKKTNPVLEKFKKFRTTVADNRVTLVVDVHEGRADGETNSYLEELQKRGVQCCQRALPVGDFGWIVEDDEKREYMMNFIIERKEMTDLKGSIMDGRYKEQKLRLKNCGLTNIYYLFEGNPNLFDQNAKLSGKALKTAIFNTVTIHDINIARTNSFKESIDWLQNIHGNVSRSFDGDFGKLLSAEEFFTQNTKSVNATVGKIFALQIRSLGNFGVDATNKVLQVFKTPREIIEAFAVIDNKERVVNICNYLVEKGKAGNFKEARMVDDDQMYKVLVKKKHLRDSNNNTLIEFYAN